MTILLLIFVNIFYSSTALLVNTCPDGWTKYHESCYLFPNVQAEWVTALTICKSFHSHLVEIDTSQENNFLESWLQGLGTADSYWTGGNDIILEREWVWQGSRSLFGFNDWDKTNPKHPEPDNYHHHQDCMKLDGSNSYKWHDAPCSDHNMFICEINLSGNQDNFVG